MMFHMFAYEELNDRVAKTNGNIIVKTKLGFPR